MIQSGPISDELLQFWAASKAGDPAQQFLYSYRILEHSAHILIDSGPRIAVKRVLKLPHVMDQIEDCVDQIVEAVQSTKSDDYSKMETLMKTSVDPAHLWELINNYNNHFSTSTEFAGGFSVEAIIDGQQSKGDFCVSGLNTVCGSLRKIRNALSHGRDQKNGSVITPTSENFRKLKPWAELVQRIAGEVMINGSSDLRS